MMWYDDILGLVVKCKIVHYFLISLKSYIHLGNRFASLPWPVNSFFFYFVILLLVVYHLVCKLR